MSKSVLASTRRRDGVPYAMHALLFDPAIRAQNLNSGHLSRALCDCQNFDAKLI